MGDQIGNSVSGVLSYIPKLEIQKFLSLPISAIDKTKILAAVCRINTLYMIARAGSGHIGSSFSSMEIMSWILLNEVSKTEKGLVNREGNIFFSSKGHDAPAYYSILCALGCLDHELIHNLRRVEGLPGHPDISTPNIITNTGSLGMGISKAKGMIIANRLSGKQNNIFVLTGDGELQEGQIWESLVSAANHALHELTVIVDHNKLQSDTLVSKVSDLGDLESKFRSFGWHVDRCDGNDVNILADVIESQKNLKKPKIIIADTIKGCGVSFMEHTSIDSDVELYKFHSGAPTEGSYVGALQELSKNLVNLLEENDIPALQFEEIECERKIPSKSNQSLIKAYSEELIKQSAENEKIVVLDADLILDTGLIPFKKEYPDRFIECGIAEQDMVSMAGGLALNGMLPVVHSFACFLSARPNEQIYNNATEKTKIIYTGSLAGVLPGGPGHSHQAVRDISSLSAIPGLVLLEPSCEKEVGLILDWAINKTELSSYIRLVSIPWEINYEFPEDYIPKLGEGVLLKEGDDVAVISYGPITLSAAISAASKIEVDSGIKVKVINLPWLNTLNKTWLQSVLESVKYVLTIDNHYLLGAQGDRIACAVSETESISCVIHKMGVEEVPVSGTNEEVLEHHVMSTDAIVGKIKSMFN